MLMKREHARPGAVDDLLLELQKIPPPGSARVDERRLAAAEGVAVWLDGGIGVTQIRILLGPEKDVRVNVDEAWHHMQARDVGHAARRCRIDVGRDPRDLRSAHGDVHESIDAVRRIDDAAVLDQQIELGSLLPPSGRPSPIPKPQARRTRPTA